MVATVWNMKPADMHCRISKALFTQRTLKKTLQLRSRLALAIAHAHQWLNENLGCQPACLHILQLLLIRTVHAIEADFSTCYVYVADMMHLLSFICTMCVYVCMHIRLILSSLSLCAHLPETCCGLRIARIWTNPRNKTMIVIKSCMAETCKLQ